MLAGGLGGRSSAAPAGPGPIKIAVFEFELEDDKPGGGPID